jgi:hypothetical protein
MDQDLNIHENIIKKLDYFYKTQKIPHLIFHGSSGTGKRTLIYYFLNKIYGSDKQKLKNNVMFVNCAHGKGIKFIRDELKFFAKTNIQGVQSKTGVMFKTIVLFSADSLTIDAQSALRRCIELFSSNTRFFIVVENKHKLLNPILSRFCEIYVPEYLDQAGETKSLHQYHLEKVYGPAVCNASWFDSFPELANATERVNNQRLLEIVSDAYEAGISCLDLVEWVNGSNQWTELEKSDFVMEFQRIKSEYRSEKLLMFYLFDFLRISRPHNS